MQSYHPPHISVSFGNPHKVMSSGRKQQVFSWWELSSTLWICLLHCFYQHGLASAVSVVDIIMHSITWFSLTDYIFSRNNQGYYFFFLFPENVELFSLWNKIAHFQTSCWVLDVMLSHSPSPAQWKWKPLIRKKKKERKMLKWDV